MNVFKNLGLVVVLIVIFVVLVVVEIEFIMYYLIVVGGVLIEVVDSIVDEFEVENFDIKVNVIYFGNYDDICVCVLLVLVLGEFVQLVVMFLIDVYDLIE